MSRYILTLTLAALALAIGAGTAAAAPRTGAVVFSRVTEAPAPPPASTEGGEAGEPGEPPAPEYEGGLFAARDGRLNQLTEDPGDSQPSFSSDGRTIAFVRDGDVWAMRADGTGQHPVTTGPAVDSRPQIAPSGRYLVFERAAAAGAQRDLYTARIGGSAPHVLADSPADESEPSFSPDGRAIVFVAGSAGGAGTVAEDVYSVRPSGAGLFRVTRTGRLDEFSPRYFRGGIVYSRGQSGTGPGAYADVYTVRRNGSRPRPLVAGAGSAFVEDVTPDGNLVLFRRDQGLWVKRIGRGRARKLTEVADNSRTNAVFSSDGRKVAAFVATDEAETLSAVDVATRRTTYLARGLSLESGSVAAGIGPVMAWQPVRSVTHRARAGHRRHR